MKISINRLDKQLFKSFDSLKNLASSLFVCSSIALTSCSFDTDLKNTGTSTESDTDITENFQSVTSSSSQGLTVVLNATDSVLDENETYQYLWEFSDGTISREEIVSHTFNQSGDHYAKFTIIDSQNKTSVSQQSFSLTGESLSVNESELLEGQLLYIEAGCNNCHGVDGAEGSTPLNFNNYTQVSLAQVIEATMPKVIGEPDDCIDSCSQRIAKWLMSIDRTPTELSVDFESQVNGLSISLSPKASTLDPNETYQYSWEFSDGHVSHEIITSHSFNVSGTHSVLLKVKNSQNEELQISKNFILDGVTLTTAQQEITEGELLYKSANCWGCHGDHGELETQPILLENFSHDTLNSVIETSMPKITGAPEDCIGDCSDKIATWLLTYKIEISCTDGISEILPRRLRKLTNDEYVLTVNELLGRSDIGVLAVDFGDDPKVHGYKTNAQAGAVTVSGMSDYWDVAKEIAQSTNAGAVNQCSSSDLTSCANQFVSEFGLKAFRRPLSVDEENTYKALFAEGADTNEGTQFVIQAMLSSNNFLYRTELGQNGVLTQYEIASLLSYTFWGSLPDAVLFEKAENNLLMTNAQLEEQAKRLLESPKAQAQFAKFAQQWLEVESIALNKDASGYPEYSIALGEAMDEEFLMFTGQSLTSETTSVDYLFNSNTTFVNSLLGNFYGFSNVPSFGFAQVNVNDQRGGILNLGALLAQYGKTNSSNPIARGVMVRERLLCQEFGKVPANVGEVEAISPNLSTRERFRQHSENEACASCHDKIDDLGFGFERYDGIGKYRTTEGNNIAVSDAGVLRSLNNYSDPDEHSFNGTNELSQILVTDGLNAVEHCVIEQFQVYMQGVEKVDACSPADVHGRWNTADGIAGLWIKSVSSKNFLNRQ